jgi:hypothetical protein
MPKIFNGDYADQAVRRGSDTKPAIEIATENLCTQLDQDNNQFDETKQDAWLQALDDYARKHERLIYSVISNHVYTLVDDDNNINDENSKYTNFESNLRAAYLSVAEANPPEDPTELVTFQRKRSYATKFYDHVNLAQKQAALLKMKKEEVAQIVDKQLKPALQEATDNFKTQMKADLDETTKTFETRVDDTVKDFKTQMKADLGETTKIFETRVDDTANNLTSQLISLVALFTALSFIVFGGISSLDSIFTVLSEKDNTVLPTIIVAIVWALCMMNLLFLFVYFILQIIASKKGTEGEKPPKKITFRGLVQKYPLVFLFNYILLSLLLFTGGAYYAWITGLGRGIYDWVLSVSDLTFILGFALIAGIIFFFGRLLYNAINPKEE